MAEQRPDDAYYSHWADHAAKRTVIGCGDKDSIVVAAGITPSGVIHIGNFREVITVDLIARALRDQGKTVRFLYSWDDFDVFRKVPKDMPNPEELSKWLRHSIVDVPDPYGKTDSYASHNIERFQASLSRIGIQPDFIRQSQQYRRGTYAQGVHKALEHSDQIRRILNRHRSEPLADDWLPLAGFCEACGRDKLSFSWAGEWEVQYQCRSCQHEASVDLRSGGNLKLPWRVDWPMRWEYEKVCFEPGGKDHSSAGGSYDTGKEIVAEVYGWSAPQYVAYDFVRIKGRGGKISSSSGGAIALDDALEIYEPELIRWIFANYRPNTEFQISFDLDVIKIYEEYDRAWRSAHESDSGSKSRSLRRTLQLASLDHSAIIPGTPAPFRAPFRLLSMVLQIFDGDIPKTLRHFEALGEIRSDAERQQFLQRAQCVWNWIDKYAPEEFCYRIRKEAVVRSLSASQSLVLERLVAALEGLLGQDSPKLPDLRSLCEDTELDLQSFSPVVYDLLIGREKGPKMSTLLPTIGFERAIPLLKPSLLSSTLSPSSES